MTGRNEALTETEVREIAREELSEAVRSAITTVTGVLLALFVVVGLQVLGFAAVESGSDALVTGGPGSSSADRDSTCSTP